MLQNDTECSAQAKFQDGNIGLADFTFLASNFNQSLPAGSLGAVVPEPAMFALVLTAPLLRRKRSAAWAGSRAGGPEMVGRFGYGEDLTTAGCALRSRLRSWNLWQLTQAADAPRPSDVAG